MAVSDTGSIWIIEIKSSIEDFRCDGKWPEYAGYCDQFYFAVGLASVESRPRRLSMISMPARKWRAASSGRSLLRATRARTKWARQSDSGAPPGCLEARAFSRGDAPRPADPRAGRGRPSRDECPAPLRLLRSGGRGPAPADSDSGFPSSLQARPRSPRPSEAPRPRNVGDQAPGRSEAAGERNQGRAQGHRAGSMRPRGCRAGWPRHVAH